MADQVQVITAQIKVEDAPLNKLVKTIQEGGADAKVLEAALAAAGIEMADLGKAAEKATKASTEGFKSLKQQLRDARNEATLLSQKFGENSQQALAATKRVAQLTEELDDFNQRVKALNPEAKFNSVQNALQGVFGALQGVTGALQLFGAENKQVEEAAKRLQGALNLAQGINSVLGLKDAFGNLRTVLGLTTAAQTGLGAATTATTVATEGAAGAARGFGLALTATGIGAIVVALGGLIAAWIAIEDSIEDAAESTENFKKQQADATANEILFLETFDKKLTEIIKKRQFEIELAKAKGATELELLRLEIAKEQAIQSALRAATATGKTRLEDEAKLQQRREEGANRLKILEVQLTRVIAEEAKKRAEEVVKAQQEANRKLENDRIQLLPSPEVAQQQTSEVLDVIGTEIENKASDLPLLPFFTPEEQRQRIEDLKTFVDNSSAIFAGLFETKTAFDQQEFADLERLRERGIINEEQYATRVRKLKQKQAEENKKAAIFQATLQAASAIINALNTVPTTAVPAAVALASIIGALNLAKIVATPIPKFKQGTLNFAGGNMDADGGSLAMLHPGEAVIPQDRNRMYAPAIRAIFNKKISPREINAFVQNRIAGGSRTLDARISSKDLRSLRPMESVSIRNTDQLAVKIGRELSKHNDLRRI